MDEKEEVKARVDIVEIVGEYVDLKKSGVEWKANCPFHDERTPSFFVVPKKQIFHCFGCGENGDVFNFLELKAGMPFLDALKYLAARVGVPLHEPEGLAEERRRLSPYREALAFAEMWFIEQLADPAGGAVARDYFDRRGVSIETRERFGLGWAPDEWHALRDAAGRHGISDDVLKEVGLIKKEGRSNDQFRGRIIFPIRETSGKVVGFGGRILGDGRPKYVNSPETSLYKKGEILYGLSESRFAIRSSERALLVEGYMDLVAVASAGFEEVVAPLGTALTEAQAELLTRSGAKEVLLLYDSDAAGLRATFKSGDTLLKHGLIPSVVSFPKGEDPDTVIQDQGAEGLERYLKAAVSVLDRKIQILREHDYFSTIARQRLAVDKLLPTLRAAVDPALRDLYLAEVERVTKVRRETLLAEIEEAERIAVERAQKRAAVNPAGRPSFDRQPRQGRGGRASVGGVPDRMGPASTLLRVLAQDRERRQEHLEFALDRIGPEDFRNEAERSIFQAFVNDPDLVEPPQWLVAEAGRYMRELLAVPPDPDAFGGAGRVLHDAVSRLVENRLYEEMERVQAAMAATQDREEKMRLLQEKVRLRSEAAALGVRWAPAARRHARGFNESN